ncbi:aspartyl protease APCB1-like isoform X1 [Hevea brasiliensis]|uniref:aspartyl protease APCB1-like isoform X1 n=1 Tax=Hevea brasiliensis TaxID=3981 RepID=UPI0025D0E8BC|nr:aspartyl protease APCB1-like isoform X1 [Hevea brasiliensis]
MDSDNSPRIKGVVIISLPPHDNPSLGKTITAFTLTDDYYNYPQSHQTHLQPPSLTLQDYQLPVQSLLPPTPPPMPQNPQIQYSSSRLSIATPRRLLGLVCIYLFALILYSSVFSRTLQELNASDDDQKTKSFIFPLFHKVVIREISHSDLKHKPLRFVYKESWVAPADDAIGPHENNKLASLGAAVDSSTNLPVRGNVFPDGLYFTYVLVGSPPRAYYLDIDTASDLSWIQCDAPCSSCAKGANALYKPRRDNIVTPKDALCMELQRNQKAGTGYCEMCQQCDYEIEYADHSSSMGVLARDELHLTMANGSSTKLNFIFGCAYDQQGLLLNTLAKTDGILGLSKAKVSLPSQLANQGIIKNVVGHCLSSDAGGGGYMFLGDDFVPQWGMAWVPMLDNLSIESYQTQIMKVNYGSTPLSSGGQGRTRQIVFDSGSSYTYFPKEAYSELVSSLKVASWEGLIQDTSDPTLPFCWRAKFPIRSVTDVRQFFKTLTLQFGSKWWIISTKFRIPPEGYLVISNKGNVCLGILDGSKVHDGSTIILGDISLRGQLVIYDNVNKKIGWAPSTCVKPTRLESLPFFEGETIS